MCNSIIKILNKEGLLIIKLNCENIYISWHIDDLHKNTTHIPLKKNKPVIKNNLENNNFLKFANKNKL